MSLSIIRYEYLPVNKCNIFHLYLRLADKQIAQVRNRTRKPLGHFIGFNQTFLPSHCIIAAWKSISNSGAPLKMPAK